MVQELEVEEDAEKFERKLGDLHHQKESPELALHRRKVELEEELDRKKNMHDAELNRKRDKLDADLEERLQLEQEALQVEYDQSLEELQRMQREEMDKWHEDRMKDVELEAVR